MRRFVRIRKRSTAAVAGVVVVAAVGLGVTAALAGPKLAAPTITSGPSGAASATSATFAYRHTASVSFTCSLDGATYTACGSGMTGSVTYGGLTDGPHTFAVRATSGTTTSPAATRSWTVDTVAPPAPDITREPSGDEMEVVQFRLASSESGVTFQCSMDGSAFTACGSNSSYKDLTAGPHCFRARARDVAGNVGPHGEHCWTVRNRQMFAVTGGPTEAFAPGRGQRLNLTVSNPNAFAIRIQTIEVQVTGVTGCGADNFTTEDFTGDVVLAGRATATLAELGIAPDDRPLLAMRNTDTNQDGCKSQSFALTYTGTAIK